MDTKLVLDTLVALPINAVFGFINDVDRKVYLSYSNDLSRSIRQKLTQYSEVSNDYRNGKIRLYYEESVNDRNTQKLLVEQLCHTYESKGYSFYHRHNYIDYEVKIYVEKDMLVYVYLVSKNFSKLIVGIFDKMDKANEFKALLERNTPVIPVFAMNELTMLHCKGMFLKRTSVSGVELARVKSKYNQIEDTVDRLE